jgi:hypothetical protein
LDAVEIAFDGFRQVLDRLGLCKPWCAFYEQVTIREKCNKQAIYEALLTYNLRR